MNSKTMKKIFLIVSTKDCFNEEISDDISTYSGPHIKLEGVADNIKDANQIAKKVFDNEAKTSLDEIACKIDFYPEIEEMIENDTPINVAFAGYEVGDSSGYYFLRVIETQVDINPEEIYVCLYAFHNGEGPFIDEGYFSHQMIYYSRQEVIAAMNEYNNGDETKEIDEDNLLMETGDIGVPGDYPHFVVQAFNVAPFIKEKKAAKPNKTMDLYRNYLVLYKNKEQEAIKKQVFSVGQYILSKNPEMTEFIYFAPLVFAFADSRGTVDEMNLVNEVNDFFKLGYQKVSTSDDPEELSEFVNAHANDFVNFVFSIAEEQPNSMIYHAMTNYIVLCLSYKKSINEEELAFLSHFSKTDLTNQGLSYDLAPKQEESKKEEPKQESKKPTGNKTKKVVVKRDYEEVTLVMPVKELKTKDDTIYEVPIVSDWETLYAIGFYSWLSFNENPYIPPKEIDWAALDHCNLDEVDFFTDYLMFDCHEKMSFEEAMREMIAYPLDTSNEGCQEEDAFVMEEIYNMHVGFDRAAKEKYLEKSLSGIHCGLSAYMYDPDPGSFNMEVKLFVMPLKDGVVNLFSEKFFNSIYATRFFIEVDGVIYLVTI